MNQEFENIGKIFQKGFEGYTVEPSKSLWAAIKYKLWLQSFIRFGVGTFNVYYASTLLVASIVGGVAIVQNLPSSENTLLSENEIFINEKLEIPAWIETKDNYYPQEYFSDIDLKTRIQNDRPEPLNEKSETKATTLPQVSQPKPENSTMDDIGILSGQPGEANGTGPKTSENLTLSTIATGNNKSNINSDDQLTTHAQGPEKLDLSSSEKEKSNVEEANTGDIVSAKEQIENIELPKIKEKETLVYDTIIVYDTLIYYDTVAIHQPKLKPRMNMSIDIYGGPNTSYFKYAHAMAGFEDTLNHFTSASSGYQVGMNINLHLNRFEISTGLSYHQIEEDFAYEELTSENNPIEYWRYSNGEPLHEIDTVDQVFMFDSVNSSFVSMPVIHETWTAQIDSDYVEIPSWTHQVKNYDNLNKYTYLNIPLRLGYTFYDRDRVSLAARAGGNLGIFINAKGKGISWTDHKSVIQLDESDLPFMKTNFSWILGMAVNYRFDERLNFIVEPWYRGSLNSMFESNHPVSAKVNSLGINIGLRFHL
ncbi:MAG: PorT family protein [Bacteroidales bacterium]|nr:PorT family protein [Bacteroidales bacterium]MCF8458523.1 PorT family protein [Bacteroidales bacterium]